ncbi:hypothetical protein JKG47_16695 [Acidithiobacillus sp. MC6.1]|nr:hypothetical protein [Acidithiobacillus sp. MC6.1]
MCDWRNDQEGVARANKTIIFRMMSFNHHEILPNNLECAAVSIYEANRIIE